MGDRTSVWIRIGGRVKNLDALAEALVAEGMGDAPTIISHMEANAADPAGVEFDADEVNYGNCDELEDECQRQGLSYEFHWYAGGGYGEGGHIFTLEGGFREYEGEAGNQSITALDIRQLKPKTVDDLLAIMDAVDQFQPGPLEMPSKLQLEAQRAIARAASEPTNEVNHG